MDFSDLGPYAWLEPIDFQQGSDATRAIETILNHDREHGTRFLETLRAFLEARQSKDAAEALFVHRNTLRYRLEGIAKLTGMDVQDPASRLVLDIQMRLAIVRGLIERGPKPAANGVRATAG
jgi:sugar diacid utilization regulator